MKLGELLRGVETLSAVAAPETEISAICADSRLVRKGALFVAIPGLQQDGAQFVPQAVQKGAAAVVSGTELAAESVPVIRVSDARAALAIIAANFHGRAAERLSIVGVTGTSGKTTTAKMLESIFDATGSPVGLIGTIEYRAGQERLVADRTTPDAIILQEWFARMATAGVQHVAMEVSSHALALRRTHGIHFAAAIFTNLSREHFDFHKDFDDYFAAKRMLFDQIDRSRTTAVVNGDDPYGRRLLDELGESAISFGRDGKHHVHPAEDFQVSVRGLHGTVVTPAGPVRVASSLLGLPNLYNWLGAIGAATLVGIERPVIEAGIRTLQSVRGRFERVGGKEGPTVIVDYAHKPDALEKLLHAVREISGSRRVVLLFGCGGDRDKGKRPEMGEIAGRLADYTIITSDNPRSEEPEEILEQIESGIKSAGRDRYERIADRRRAIAQSIAGAGDEDVVVIAGKGHETYQVVGDQVLHFDDREEAELALKKRSEKVHSKTGIN